MSLFLQWSWRKFILTHKFIILNQNPCMMKTLIMKGVRTSNNNQCNKKGEKKTPNKTQVYALIISQLLRSRSPNCWWQVKQSKDLNDSNVSNHIKTTIVGQRTVSLTATRLIVWLVVVYIQTAHIYQEKHAETFGALIWAVNRKWA